MSKYTANAEETDRLVTFHKPGKEMGRSNEQSQLLAVTIAKPSWATGALGDTAGQGKIQREVTKRGKGLPFLTESCPPTLMEESWQGATARKMR